MVPNTDEFANFQGTCINFFVSFFRVGIASTNFVEEQLGMPLFGRLIAEK